MKTLRKLDDYFIGAHEGNIEDRIYFYGTYVVAAVIFVATVIAL
jgi:hypothetical protein